MKQNVIVVGAGPAGMMAAITASKKGHDVTLLESNDRLGKKLFITGKGRCNVTNSKDIGDFFDFIPGNPYFLYSALYTYTNDDTINFFTSQGIKLKAERGGRIFPESNKSSDIIKGLEIQLKENNVKILLNSKVTEVTYTNNIITGLTINNNHTIKGTHYIFATGGVSYEATGSKGDGHKFSKILGHKIIDLKPSLVPIELNEPWLKELMGLSLRNIEFSIVTNNKTIFKQRGELLFTHFGISGPLVLSGSRYINTKDTYTGIIDFKPALSEKELDIRIQKDFTKNCNKTFKNSLNELLPQKLIPIIISLSGISPDKKVNEITRNERKVLLKLLKQFNMNILRLRPLNEAIVTAGGVDTKEIDPSTMKSKIINNLSFAGELIDVDAFTGGYNVQIAFSTGFLAGSNI